MDKKYRIDIEKWKQNGLTGQWGPLWPTDDCEEDLYETLGKVNWLLQKCDSAEEVGRLRQWNYYLEEHGGNVYAEYQELVRPFWMELADPEVFRKLDYRFRAWSDPWYYTFLNVRFEETDRLLAQEHTKKQNPLSAAEYIINYWIQNHIDAFPALENGFSWRWDLGDYADAVSYRVTATNDWVYFCIKSSHTFDDPTCGHGAKISAVPLETVNEILACFPNAEAEHRKQRRKLLKQRNWNYSIFAYDAGFDQVKLGVAFEDSLEKQFGVIPIQNFHIIDRISYRIYDYARYEFEAFVDLKSQPSIQYSHESFANPDDWVDDFEYCPEDGEIKFYQFSLPRQIFMDILMDMRKIIDTLEPRLKGPDHRPVLSSRRYPREAPVSKDTADSADRVREHRIQKHWRQVCLSGKKWPPP